ncbi:DUF805 domain-containing protein [Undibacterium sp. SXout20W]|uniref:DUF805 domain-containing protein n=1 Tax=Undibacterium sp. SXout20W TaxID=3413051 RepID=UPI003BF1E910
MSYFVRISDFYPLLLQQRAGCMIRLHDTNRSGWMQLIALVPVLGIVILLVFLAQETVVDNNEVVSP